MGTLCTESNQEGAKCIATVAAIFSKCADSGECNICALGVGCLDWLERAPVVFGIRHHSVMGSLLHDLPVGHVLLAIEQFSRKTVANMKAVGCLLD